MMYHVEFSEGALKQLKKLDKPIAALILGWIRKNLENCTDPRQHGKALVGNHAGHWRYRIGDYRVLAEIEDDNLRVLVIGVIH